MYRNYSFFIIHLKRSFTMPTPFPPAAVPLLLDWYRQNRRDLPWRHSRDPYRVLVSEIMLQQTRTETVKPYFHRFLAMPC